MECYVSYTITAIAAVVTILVLYIKWSLNYWKRRNIPYLEPSFPFGNFENPITNEKPQGISYQEFYQKFKEMGVSCGGVYSYWSPIFMPINPEYTKHILVKDFAHFQARGFYQNEKYQPISANLFTHDGDKWRTLRTKFTPTFTSAKIKFMFNLAVKALTPMEKHIEEQAIKKLPLNLKDCAIRFTTDVIGSCAFGIEVNSFEDLSFNNKLRECFTKASSFFTVTFCIALPKLAQFLRVPLFPTKQAESIGNSVVETVKYRTENNITRNDFLQMVIEMKHKDVINLDELQAQCLMFFIAGYETSSTTMTFLLYELAHNPDVQEKLRNEINEALDKNGGELTYEVLQSMKYLDMVLCETLRKFPSVPILHRKCVRDFQLPNSNMVIEKDTLIIVPGRAFHFDPEYFPNPDKFDPERFSEENKAKIVPYTYLPFGEGPRNCIGDRFGKMQVKIGVIGLLRKYRYKFNSKTQLPVQFETNFMLIPKKDILLDIEILSK